VHSVKKHTNSPEHLEQAIDRPTEFSKTLTPTDVGRPASRFSAIDRSTHENNDREVPLRPRYATKMINAPPQQYRSGGARGGAAPDIAAGTCLATDRDSRRTATGMLSTIENCEQARDTANQGIQENSHPVALKTQSPARHHDQCPRFVLDTSDFDHENRPQKKFRSRSSLDLASAVLDALLPEKNTPPCPDHRDEIHPHASGWAKKRIDHSVTD